VSLPLLPNMTILPIHNKPQVFQMPIVKSIHFKSLVDLTTLRSRLWRTHCKSSMSGTLSMHTLNRPRPSTNEFDDRACMDRLMAILYVCANLEITIRIMLCDKYNADRRIKGPTAARLKPWIDFIGHPSLPIILVPKYLSRSDPTTALREPATDRTEQKSVELSLDLAIECRQAFGISTDDDSLRTL
jgi:hypothetical protein